MAKPKSENKRRSLRTASKKKHTKPTDRKKQQQNDKKASRNASKVEEVIVESAMPYVPAKSPYINFCIAHEEEVKTSNPDANALAIGQILGLRWALLGDDERNKYK